MGRFCGGMTISSVIPGLAKREMRNLEPKTSGFRVRCFAPSRNDGKPWPRSAFGRLRPGSFVADGEELHRAVGDDDAEGGAERAFDEVNVAAMGADQLGSDGKA